MTKNNENIELSGEVIENLPNAMFKVLLEGNDILVLCHASGRIRQNKIQIIPGDHVMVQMTPYDLTKGRIIYRL